MYSLERQREKEPTMPIKPKTAKTKTIYHNIKNDCYMVKESQDQTNINFEDVDRYIQLQNELKVWQEAFDEARIAIDQIENELEEYQVIAWD